MTLLTKADILQGVDAPKKILIEALQGEIWLRPLSSAEVHEVQHIEAEGYGNFQARNARGQTNTEGKMNLAKMQVKQAEAKYEAIYKSINNPKNTDEWTYDDLKKLPTDAVNEMYDHVLEISGVEVTEADIKQFPEDE
jgi:hypothetical protein